MVVWLSVHEACGLSEHSYQLPHLETVEMSGHISAGADFVDFFAHCLIGIPCVLQRPPTLVAR